MNVFGIGFFSIYPIQNIAVIPTASNKITLKINFSYLAA